MAARSPRAGRWTRRQFLVGTGGVALIGWLAEACTPAVPSPPSSSTSAGPTATARTAGPTAGPTTAARAGGQAIISFGEPDTLLSSASRSLVFAYIRSFIANGLLRLKYPDMTVVEDLADKYS